MTKRSVRNNTSPTEAAIPIPIATFCIQPVDVSLSPGVKIAVSCLGQLMVTMIVSLLACDSSVKLPFH